MSEYETFVTKLRHDGKISCIQAVKLLQYYKSLMEEEEKFMGEQYPKHHGKLIDYKRPGW